MTSYTEPTRPGECLVSEANGSLSREAVTIAAGADLAPGTVLGRILTGTATASTLTGTGNGAIGAVTKGVKAEAGVYTLTCVQAIANGGRFEVVSPGGRCLSSLFVGQAYDNGHFALTVADGSTDFVVGDRFTVTVAAGSGKYLRLDPAGTDGRQTAAAVLYGLARAAAADCAATAIVRQAEVKLATLVWPSGIADAAKTAAIAALGGAGILCR